MMQTTRFVVFQLASFFFPSSFRISLSRVFLRQHFLKLKTTGDYLRLDAKRFNCEEADEVFLNL